ncbi:MAG TPA: hypothetical protein VM490_26780 [Armatimonadaceae bacterium]|nr:hypothetical protein [Armatimonadaceae bacterium]
MSVEPSERARSSVFGPSIYGIAIVVMNVAFIVAGLAAAYLIYGLVVGGLGDFGQVANADEKRRILSNIAAASKGLTWGLAVGALAAAVVFLGEETIGYVILGIAAAIGLGIPFGFTSFGGESMAPERSIALRQVFNAFVSAAYIPAGIGGLLIVRDILLRLVRGVQKKPVEKEKMNFGQNAQKESRPVRLSLLGKCWEGPYCREFIRVHCPIYHKRAACWKQRRGCYCDEDIVSTAAAKVQGVQLDMAPDQRYNFANAAQPGSAGQPVRKIVLSPAQKRERCRNCIIYNQHQTEKYQLLMPAFLIGSVVLCLAFNGLMRHYLGAGLDAIETLMGRISFLPGDPAGKVAIGRPSGTVEWVLVGAITVMVVSKVLQTLEWAIYKLKI